MLNRFTSIDLFAGIGGFRNAVENRGGRTVAFSEIDRDAINAYTINYPDSENTNLGDITAIKQLPTHDLLTAGVPCQSWSIAGKNLGFDDDRGQLWNDAIYLLKNSQPKAFIFENVKGLSDPRNEKALAYIMTRIENSGYHAAYYVLNSYDYGVPQSRIRIYIIGFRNARHHKAFRLPKKTSSNVVLKDIIEDRIIEVPSSGKCKAQLNLFGEVSEAPNGFTSLSKNNNGYNDYFLFNDLRNGSTTIHSWDILSTTKRQKDICYILLRNRRKKNFGPLDGNPLSVEQFQIFDKTISDEELKELISIGILKNEKYAYYILDGNQINLTEHDKIILDKHVKGVIIPDRLVYDKEIRIKKIKVFETLERLEQNGIVKCCETRYDFKHTKISTGLFGVGRIFLPSSKIFPTLVASDTNDYVTPVSIMAWNEHNYRQDFINHIYNKKMYRKISKVEACRLQGFPNDFHLPESRSRWMKLIGNSVSIPVIEKLIDAIIETGVFDEAQSCLISA